MTATNPRIKEKCNVNVINYNTKVAEAQKCRCPQMRPTFPQQISLAMAYVPFQKWDHIYTPQAGFERGTVFADLDKPFMGADPCDC